MTSFGGLLGVVGGLEAFIHFWYYYSIHTNSFQFLWGWAPMGPCGPAYRLATTLKKLKPPFYMGLGPHRTLMDALGTTSNPVWGWGPIEPCGPAYRLATKKIETTFYMGLGHQYGLGCRPIRTTGAEGGDDTFPHQFFRDGARPYRTLYAALSDCGDDHKTYTHLLGAAHDRTVRRVGG